MSLEERKKPTKDTHLDPESGDAGIVNPSQTNHYLNPRGNPFRDPSKSPKLSEESPLQFQKYEAVEPESSIMATSRSSHGAQNAEKATRSPDPGSPELNYPWQRPWATGTPMGSPDGSRTQSTADCGMPDGAGLGINGFPQKEESDRLEGGKHQRLDGTETQSLMWRERVRHFTWTWFTMTMATGQIASVIYHVPYRFPGLYAIGCIFFLLNIVLFIFNVTMMSLRFRYHPSTLKASFRHPTESLFVPAAVISIGTILTNITEYGWHQGKTGPWLIDVMVVLFWIYCGVALSFTCGIYLIMWSTQTFTISQMTPVWIFPAYPLLVIGPHAGVLSKYATGNRGLDVIVGGFVMQGIGFMVSLMVYAAFLYRLMTQKLPKESLRPGMFISVGPSGFTISGVINMAANLSTVIPPNFMGVGPIAATISVVIANWMGIWLWGLAIFFLIVSIGAHWSCVGNGRFHFAMTWFSFIFPNTGLTTATFAVGKALGNKPIRIVGCVFTCLLIVVWFFVIYMMVRAVVIKQILWPQKQEDRDEGGWKSEAENAYSREEASRNQMRRRDFAPGLESRQTA